MRFHLLAPLLGLLLLTSGTHAQTASPPKEGTGTGSGSTGMAPQQGTGSGATQVSPGANRPQTGHGPGADTQQNREYGKDTSPDGQGLHQGQPPSSKP